MDNSTISRTAQAVMKMALNDDPRLLVYQGINYSDILRREEIKRDRYIEPGVCAANLKNIPPERILDALIKCKTKKMAAELLGISESALVNKMNKFGIRRVD